MRRLYHGHQLQGKPLPSNPWVQNIFALQLILNLKKFLAIAEVIFRCVRRKMR